MYTEFTRFLLLPSSTLQWWPSSLGILWLPSSFFDRAHSANSCLPSLTEFTQFLHWQSSLGSFGNRAYSVPSLTELIYFFVDQVPLVTEQANTVTQQLWVPSKKKFKFRVQFVNLFFSHGIRALRPHIHSELEHLFFLRYSTWQEIQERYESSHHHLMNRTMIHGQRNENHYGC